MLGKRIDQKDNSTEGGDIAGGDITKIVEGNYAGRDQYNINHIYRPADEYMQSLIAQFKREKENNIIISKIVDNLNHYSVNLDSDEVYTLENKLKDGNRSRDYKRALFLKELITKKIKLNEDSEAAQEIYAYMLSQICSDFHSYISPELTEKSISEINQLIDQKVIKPAMETLGENVLRILKDDINGMIYFLTGNCHIKWI